MRHSQYHKGIITKKRNQRFVTILFRERTHFCGQLSRNPVTIKYIFQYELVGFPI
tara:strand:- start:95142 stop:95306 length:165 start_codon:yes stop_codon:yes gene_type:complete